MLSHLYKLVNNFEKAHGILPTLLYLNYEHINQLKLSFNNEMSMQQIIEMLQLEIIVQKDVIHPHVLWTQPFKKANAF